MPKPFSEFLRPWQKDANHSSHCSFTSSDNIGQGLQKYKKKKNKKKGKKKKKKKNKKKIKKKKKKKNQKKMVRR